MKTHPTPARTAAWLLLAAPALFAVPAVAQDASTAPPPVRATLPQADTAQALPPSRETGNPVEANTASTQSRTTIAPGAGDVVDDARRPAARSANVRPVTQTATTRATTTRAPIAVAPSPAPITPAPVAETPAPVAVAPAPEAVPVADAPVDTATTTTTATTDSGPPLWPLALIAALIVAAGAFFLMRRRRADADEAYAVQETHYEAEPVYVAPVAEPAAYVAPIAVAAAPVAVTPVIDPIDAYDAEPVAAGLAEDATVTDAPAEDVAALTDAAPPVRNRPWLEFAMRPVRAGTSADEALVEIELTVANSGTVEAHDVRVSTFMLTDAHASEMERMMVDAPANAAIDPVNIAPGEGTRIDATLAALKSDLGSEGHFNPVVVAEARYRLPDGSEGRTAASFVVGVSGVEGGAMTPIDLADRVMRDDIEAHLHGEVEHA